MLLSKYFITYCTLCTVMYITYYYSQFIKNGYSFISSYHTGVSGKIKIYVLMYSAHLLYTFGLVCQTAMTNHSMNKPTDQRRGSHTKRNNTRDAKDQAWERNPSGKPTNEERARKTGLFQYQDCWSKDRDSWPFLSTPPSPPTPLLTPPPPPPCAQSPG